MSARDRQQLGGTHAPARCVPLCASQGDRDAVHHWLGAWHGGAGVPGHKEPEEHGDGRQGVAGGGPQARCTRPAPQQQRAPRRPSPAFPVLPHLSRAQAAARPELCDGAHRLLRSLEGSGLQRARAGARGGGGGSGRRGRRERRASSSLCHHWQAGGEGLRAHDASAAVATSRPRALTRPPSHPQDTRWAARWPAWVPTTSTAPSPSTAWPCILLGRRGVRTRCGRPSMRRGGCARPRPPLAFAAATQWETEPSLLTTSRLCQTRGRWSTARWVGLTGLPTWRACTPVRSPPAPAPPSMPPPLPPRPPGPHPPHPERAGVQAVRRACDDQPPGRHDCAALVL